MDVAEIIERLKHLYQGGRFLVAFSGGVDSTLAAYLASRIGDRTILATIRTELTPRREIEHARSMARNLNLEHVILEERVLDLIRENPPDRCYLCKRKLFSRLSKLARDLGAILIDGTNLDDLRSNRPGVRALRELGVRSPLAELGLGKNRIRELARELGLPNHSRPSNSCLATRFPYNFRLSERLLKMVDDLEEELSRILGEDEPLRVRFLGREEIRVEYGNPERLLRMRNEIERIVEDFGLRVRELDRYRSGYFDEKPGG